MGPFRFRLQKVLDYRHLLVQQGRLDVAALERQQQEEAARLAELRSTERAAFQALTERQATIFDVADAIHATRHLQALRERIAEQAAVVQEIEAQVEVARAALGTTARRAKSLEKLRDGQEEDHQREVGRAEQAESAEVGARRHQREAR